MMNPKEIYEMLVYQKMVSEHPSSYRRDPEQFDRAFKPLGKFPAIRSAAQLEKVIVNYIKMMGHSASKVSTQGTYLKGKKTVSTNVLGHKYVNQESGKYMPGGGRKGASDISATVYGLSVMIEVKFSKGDRLSKEQKAYAAEIQNAGGFFMVAHRFEDFFEKFKELLDHPKMVLLASM